MNLPHLLRICAVGITLFAAVSCQRDAPLRSPVDLSTVQQLGRGDVSQLRMEKTDSVVLGTAAESVGEVTSLLVSRDTLYVLDAPSKRVRLFDHTGRLLNTIGREGRGPGEFRDPTAIARTGNGLLVADPGNGTGVPQFDPQGRYVARRKFGVSAEPTTLAVTGNVLGQMGMLDIQDPEKEGWNVVRMSNLSGDSIGTGCVMDPRFMTSYKQDGMLSRFGFGSLTAADGKFYCTQAISPVVQVMDSTGRPLSQIRIAPPFYRAPHDEKLTINQKAIFAYLGTFTAHGQYVPLQGGFASVYSRFDPDRGEIRYHLLVCRDGTPKRCGTLENIGHPLHIPSLDTVYVQEELQPDRPVQIGIYRIAGLTR